MKHLHCTSPLVIARLLLALSIALIPVWAAIPADAAPAAVSREIEPVVVSGVLPGAPVDEVFVYVYTGTEWKQILHQVDERTASGEYIDSEDGVMDANDEVVFMAGDLGVQATEAITESLDVDPQFIHEVEVANPLDDTDTDKGWAYIVRSSTLTPDGSLTPYVEGYDDATQVITTANYEVGWAEDFGGLDYLSILGGPDILDRTKLRAEVSIPNFPTQSFTEEDIESQNVALDKQGPVRVIVHVVPNPQLVDVINTTTFAYGSYMNTVTQLDVSSLLENAPVTPSIDSIRFSMDLTPDAAPATYYSETAPGGVPVDGTPEAVPGTPFTQGWRQISLANATTVQVYWFEGDLQANVQHYYQDNSALGGSADLGDDQVYGDSGVILLDAEGEQFTIYSAQYFLPDSQDNVGAAWYGYSQTPLTVTATNIGEGPDTYDIYLPNVIKP